MSARLVRTASRDSVAGAPTAITAPNRKPRTVARSRPRSRSWLSTPATETVRPLDVDRKAANAPAVTSADTTSPHGEPSIRSGSNRTTASVRPVISGLQLVAEEVSTILNRLIDAIGTLSATLQLTVVYHDNSSGQISRRQILPKASR